MKSCSWNRVLLQPCLLLAFATGNSAALPFPHPSLVALTTGISSSRAASNPDLHFTYPTFDSLKTGTPFNITWEGASGPTTLIVHQATVDGIRVESTTATGITESYLIWTPPSTISGTEYTFQLKDETSGTSISSNAFQTLDQGLTDTESTTTTQNPLHEIHVRNPAPSHPDISTTAKICVGVGSALITLIVIGVIVLYRVHSRRKQRRNYTAAASRTTSSDCFSHDGMPPASMVEVPAKTYARPRDPNEMRPERWR